MDSLLCDEVWLCSPITTTVTTPPPPPPPPPSRCNEPTCLGDHAPTCCCDSTCFNTVTKEDCQHSLAMFIDKEHTYMLPQPAAYLFHLHRSTSLLSARCTAIHWLLKMQINRLSLATVFSAANYLDRFMSMHPTLEWETWMVELVTVACLSVASKFNESSSSSSTNAPSLYDFNYEMEHCFQPATIQQMELLLLQSLQWRLASTTSYSYLQLILLAWTPMPKELSGAATRFLVGALHECKFVEYRPSSVAISAVWCGVEELASSDDSHCRDLATRIVPRLIEQSGHKDDVIRCHGRMMEMEMEMGCRICSRSGSCSWSSVSTVVMCRDDDDDSHVDLSVFNGEVGSGWELMGKKMKMKKKKKKRKWDDLC